LSDRFGERARLLIFDQSDSFGREGPACPGEAEIENP
jgi:hypothetical protein